MGTSRKKYERAKKGLAKGVLSASLALHEGVVDENKASALIKSGARTVLRKHGAYVLDAGWALIHKMDTLGGVLEMPTKSGKEKVKLFSKPLEEFLTELSSERR